MKSSRILLLQLRELRELSQNRFPHGRGSVMDEKSGLSRARQQADYGRVGCGFAAGLLVAGFAFK